MIGSEPVMTKEEKLKHYPGTKNLRSWADAPKAVHLAASSKGGKTVTEAQRRAAKLRELKKKIKIMGITDGNIKKTVEIMEDPSASVLDIKSLLDEMRLEAVNLYQRDKVAMRLIDLHKLHHGEKLKMESKNVNINIDLTEKIFSSYQDRMGEKDA